MKRVIDYLKEADKEKMAELFLQNDILLMVLDVMNKEECIWFINDICKMEGELENSSYVILMHPGFLNNELKIIYRINNMNENKTVSVVSFPEISLMELLSAEVPSMISTSSQIESMLLCVLHAAFSERFAKDLFGKHTVKDESVESEMDIIDQFTEEEKELLYAISDAVNKFNNHFLEKAYHNYLLEVAGEIETKGGVE